jgi:type IV pilus assembly protein PilE
MGRRRDMTDVRLKGFSLTELLIVVSVVAILLTLILPAYQLQLMATRRSLGGAALLETMMRQEQYFVDHKRYAEILTELAYPTHPYAIDAQGSIVDDVAENRIYLIELTTRVNAYTLFATPQLGQAADRDCGTLSLDSSGQKRATGGGQGRSCW